MANVKKGRPKGFTQSAEVLDREAEVVKLRRGGMTWDMIAQRTGFANPSSARQAFERANLRVIRDDVEALRVLEEDRLDILQTAYWGKALGGDLPAAQYVLKVAESRRKLLGLDMPVRQQVEVISYDANSIQSELARIYAAALRHSTDSDTPLQVGSDTGETESVTAK
jgi:hypothetical protein